MLDGDLQHRLLQTLHRWANKHAANLIYIQDIQIGFMHIWGTRWHMQIQVGGVHYLNTKLHIQHRVCSKNVIASNLHAHNACTKESFSGPFLQIGFRHRKKYIQLWRPWNLFHKMVNKKRKREGGILNVKRLYNCFFCNPMMQKVWCKKHYIKVNMLAVWLCTIKSKKSDWWSCNTPIQTNRTEKRATEIKFAFMPIQAHTDHQ